MTWKLKRVRQCAKCPWKTSTDPREIPNGYDEAQHKALTSTIATPGVFDDQSHVMGCHEHPPGEEAHCVGWLVNQINEGNNIPLRISMLDCENLRDVRLDGPQHKCLEDTFPRDGIHDE